MRVRAARCETGCCVSDADRKHLLQTVPPQACAVDFAAMTRDANALLRDALQLPTGERQEIAARLLAQESSVVSADPRVMSGAPVFRGTRVLVQTLIEHLEAGDSIDDFLEGFPSVTRDQVIAFLEETKARVVAYAE